MEYAGFYRVWSRREFIAMLEEEEKQNASVPIGFVKKEIKAQTRRNQKWEKG